jgi:alpha-mannosidase
MSLNRTLPDDDARVIRHRAYTRERLAQTSERLRALVYPETRPVDRILVSPRVDRISWEEAQRLGYREARVGEEFGPLWATYWFRVSATVPEEWRGRRVALLWRSGSEATLWLDGAPVQGLSPEREDATLAEHAERWEREQGVRVSLWAVDRALSRLGITRKKRRSTPASRTP